MKPLREAQEIQGQPRQDGDDDRRLEKALHGTAEATHPVPLGHQKRNENEPDEELMAEVNDGNVAHVVQAVGGPKERNADHPELETGHEEGIVLVIDPCRSAQNEAVAVEEETDRQDQREQT